jgi:hypothetical protein
MKKEALLRAVEILAGEPDLEKQLLRLRSAGFSDSDAEVLANVLPEAFAIPVLEHLGIASVSDVASARTRWGRWVNVRLSKNPVFVAALSLAREHRASGVLDQNAYRAIAERSALVDAGNQALNAGDSLKGGTVKIAFNGAIAENLGYRPWYLRLWKRHAG